MNPQQPIADLEASQRHITATLLRSIASHLERLDHLHKPDVTTAEAHFAVGKIITALAHHRFRFAKSLAIAHAALSGTELSQAHIEAILKAHQNPEDGVQQ